MEFSTEKLKPLAEEMALMIRQKLTGKETYKEREIESEIRKQLLEMGRLTFGMVLSQLDGIPEREIPCECGGMLSYQRRRPAQVISVFNRVEYERNYYAGCQCGTGKAPMRG